ncbi:MAG: DUF819 family protein [Bacteroidales bacterium]|nr:DUF819 family protein [Bacteroidales bacterium]
MLLYLVYLFLTPAAVMLLARRWTWIDKVSPMAVLYVIGLLVANLTSWLRQPGLLDTNNLIGQVCIPLSIPLMLMSCSLSHWSTGKALKAGLSGFAAILVTIVAGYFLFRGHSSPLHFAQVSAVAVGIYTGGIPNMGAIAHGVGMDHETYLYITSYDLIVTALYLVFVICFGKPLFRKLLPAQATPAAPPSSTTPLPGQSSRHKHPLPLLTLPLALAIAVVAYLLSTLFPDSLSTPMLILILTTLSIAASFIPFVQQVNRQAESRQRQPLAFTVGLYFVYLFCFSIANGCDIRQLDLSGSLNILWYILFIIFASLLIQILLARLLHLDGDSTLVTSVALINSPPFVPLVAALLNNKDLTVLGITIGLIGYLVGNYLGLAVFFLLSL